MGTNNAWTREGWAADKFGRRSSWRRGQWVARYNAGTGEWDVLRDTHDNGVYVVASLTSRKAIFALVKRCERGDRKRVEPNTGPPAPVYGVHDNPAQNHWREDCDQDASWFGKGSRKGCDICGARGWVTWSSGFTLCNRHGYQARHLAH